MVEMNARSPGMRALVYALRTFAMIALVIMLCWVCYSMGKQMSAAYVISYEGMSARADVILNEGTPDNYDETQLSEYFLSQAIEQDTLLAAGQYQEYVVSNYDYTPQIKSILVWPWGKSATVRIQEIASQIEGKANEISAQESGDLESRPPQWNEKIYNIHLQKNDQGRWYISELEVLAEGMDQEETPSAASSPTSAVQDEEPDQTEQSGLSE